jgi:small-conductance mechanosensitive channel
VTWLLAQIWAFTLVSFLLGAVITRLVLTSRHRTALQASETERRFAGEAAGAAAGDRELSEARAQADQLRARLAEQDEDYHTKVADLEADLNETRARLADFEMRLERQAAGPPTNDWRHAPPGWTAEPARRAVDPRDGAPSADG